VILLLLFVVIPIVELWVIIRVGSAIGFLNTLAIIIVVAVLGSWLVKREGLRVWRRFTESVSRGRVPTRELVDGVLILGAGALLLTPGFVTDVVGVLMLFPPTRAVIRSLVMRSVKKRTIVVRRGEGWIDADSTEPRGEL